MTHPLARIRTIVIPRAGHPVEKTIALEARRLARPGARIIRSDEQGKAGEKETLRAAVAGPSAVRRLRAEGIGVPEGRAWTFIDSDEAGNIRLLASHPAFLYAAFTDLIESPPEGVLLPARRRLRPMSFEVQKSTFDLFLTQYGRTLRGFDRERYVREYARLGFTHIEVNALAAPFPNETGVPGEFYPDFYTYCPALDQFVESRLNRGLIPREQLSANRARLKENARLAIKYGLVPGLLCFEPRSVPEKLFDRYPTLRGPRVDHPFRSFKPRYALSLAHPLARAHYAELIANLLREVPELEFMSVWSNDSGSGFEHTKSLYVGRNGGAYMIREWKSDTEIARAAADNIVRYYRVLRDAARAINPRFRVITRLESFYGERAQLWPGLRDGIDVEVNSLLAVGWENNYPHPAYPDIPVLGSGYHNTLAPAEAKAAAEIRARDSRSYFFHFFNSHGNHEPLLGIPFPWLTHDKLRACARRGVPTLAHMGGLQPPDKVPYAVNQEVFRAFQFDAGLDIDATVLAIARRWAGRRDAAALVRGWRKVEAAIRKFVPMSLYSGFGTVWNRLLVRPLVPDIDRIPVAERAYYEEVMVSPVHNPNKVDLGKDVLFELIPKAYARMAYRRIDAGVWKPLLGAIVVFRERRDAAVRRGDARAAAVFEDQYVRTLALRALYETLRNTAVWIYAVHEYQETKDAGMRRAVRALLDRAIAREIDNSAAVMRLWQRAGAEWMAVSGFGETPFIYGENFPGLLRKRIALMKKHRRDRPFIDPDYMFRVENDPYDPDQSAT
jgi:hypothetical protein